MVWTCSEAATAQKNLQTPEQTADTCNESENPEAEIDTRRGRQIKKLARYHSVTVLKSSPQKEKEVVRTQEIMAGDGDVT